MVEFVMNRQQQRGMEAIEKLKVIAAGWRPRTFWSNKTPTMHEREQAILIANRILNNTALQTLYMRNDPNCDAAILARQYLRALEKLELRDARPT